MTPKRTSDEAAETRAVLLRAGRARFGAEGFAATTAEGVARYAGVTRGALVHHFVDKKGLFAAVLEMVEEDVAGQVVSAALDGAGPLEWLLLGFDAFLAACVDPGVSQIMLIDGPSVLGWEVWHQIDSRYGYAPVLGTVRAAIDAGELTFHDPEALASLLLGALTEAATLVGRSEDGHAVRTRMADSLSRLINGLIPSAG